MEVHLWIIFFSGFVAAIVALEETVDTTSGIVMGIQTSGTNVVSFLGIPYAEPPIGELRFKSPMKKNRMSGTFDATSHGFVCPQKESAERTFAQLLGTVSMDEDCLNLNIYAPVTASKTAPLSVMVWIHGGEYVHGAGSFYDSKLLVAPNNVIVVTINFRLGILGFLNTMDDNSVGNFALRDQCLALRWVKENIEEFGGNSSSITIFGESSGASSVTQLTMAVSCQGLFHRVIAQSGSALAPWSHNPNPVKIVKELGNNLDCPTDNTSLLVQCLRGKSANDILKYQTNYYISFLTPLPWGPIYSSDFFSFAPKELPEWANIPTVNTMSEFDFLIGVNMEEGEMYYNSWLAHLEIMPANFDPQHDLPDSVMDASLANIAKSYFPRNSRQADKLLPALRFHYTDWQNLDSKFTNSKMIVELIGDTMFYESSVQYARLHAELRATDKGDNSDERKTYFYRLKPRPSWLYSRPWTHGASHADDVMFLFGVPLLEGPLSVLIGATAEEKQFSHVMMEYWTNFAKTGNPNEPSKRYISTEWPVYNLNEEEYIDLDLKMTPDSTGKHPYARRVAFWDSFMPEQIKLLREESEPEPDPEPCRSKVGSRDVNAYVQSFPSSIAALLIAGGILPVTPIPYSSEDVPSVCIRAD